MGQKINPISLRLQKTNRGYDSCWYSDYHYSELFAFDLKVRNYLERVLKQVKYPGGRALITHFSKASKINLFAFNPSSSRQQRLEGFGLKGVKEGRVNSSHLNTLKTRPLALHKSNCFPKKTVLIDQESAPWQQFPNVATQDFVPYLALPRKTIPAQSNQDKTNGQSPCTTLKAQDCRERVLPLFALRDTFKPLYNLKVKRLETACFGIACLACLWQGTQGTQGTQRAYKGRDKTSYTLKREVEAALCKTLWSQRACLARPTQSVLLSLGVLGSQREGNTTPFLTGLGALCKPVARKGQGCSTQKTSGFKEFLYRPHVERVLDLQGGVSAKLVGFVVSTEKQSALFLAHEVVYLLEKRIPFRKIKDQISKELKDSKTVKGIRITCSGRVGGKSKKAQKAKMETFKQGQTSLHVFSSKIDFAQKSALTNFGLVGVKVWICFY